MPEVKYDDRADAVSIRLRDGEPRYTVVGRGSFVIYADDNGIWAIDLEVERWDDAEVALMVLRQ